MFNRKNRVCRLGTDTNKGIEILDYLYEQCLSGIPRVSKPVEELARDYTKKYGYSEEAITKLIKNQISKNTINGFVTSFGGFTTMAVTLPANITSVIYVQMRMVAAIAIIRGYDLHDDEVQTFVYSCIVGKSATDVFKNAGVNLGNKVGKNMVNKIPGKTLTKINQKIGFRFITKGGEKGIVNLGKAVPLVGAGIGSAMDYTTTKIIANRAKNFFQFDGIDFSSLEK